MKKIINKLNETALSECQHLKAVHHYICNTPIVFVKIRIKIIKKIRPTTCRKSIKYPITHFKKAIFLLLLI